MAQKTIEPTALKRALKLIVFAGAAKPSAKLGQALGPLGINMAAFCKDFNEKTQGFLPDTPMRVRMHVFYDNTYKLNFLGPPISWMVKRAAGIQFGSDFPGHIPAGEISIKYIYEIAKIKQQIDKNMWNIPLESICKSIIGQCRSMGVEVVSDSIKPLNKPIHMRKISGKPKGT